MSTSEGVSRIAGALERALTSVARATHRRPAATLVLTALLVGVAALSAKNLRLNTDLATLLPRTFQSVRDLDLVKERFGGVGYVVVVAQDADGPALRRFADDIAPKLAELSSVSYVDYKRPDAFFEARGLYYLNADDLEILVDRIEARANYERKKANPLLLDLEDTGPPSLDFSDLRAKYERGSVARVTRKKKKDPYYYDENRRLIALLVKPSQLATNLSFTKKTVEEVQAVVASLNPTDYSPTMTVSLTGRYKKKIDQQAAIEKDLGVTSAIALLLVIFYLGFHFRRFAAVALIIVPLLAGLAWTFGMAAVAFDSLNILTGFVGAMLLGLGIDHGIHLLARYQEERAAGATSAEAIDLTFSNTGRAVLLAGVTTMIGFAGLSVSEFRAFREFGLITAFGMFFMVLAYTTLLPALLAIAARLSWKAPPDVQGPLDRYAKWVPKAPRGLFLGSTIAILLIASFTGQVRFNYDFADLDGGDIPSFKLDKVVNETLGRSQTPILVLTDDKADERAAAQALRARSEQAGSNSGVDFVISVADLVPREQSEKAEILEELQEVLEKIDDGNVPAKDLENFRRLKKMSVAKPFARADLPIELRRQFQPLPGAHDGGLVLVFPSVSLSDGARVIDLANEVRSIPLPDGRQISAAGEAMVLADVLSMVFAESPIVVVVTLVLVFLSLWILLGRFSTALLCFIPAVTTVLITMGAAALLGVKLNYLNIVMIPVLFGIAVDGGVHLVVRGGNGVQSLTHSVAETGRAILGATLTTGAGFGALLLVTHPGLHSFGEIAMLGLGANLFSSLVWLVSILALRAHCPAARRAACTTTTSDDPLESNG